MRPDSIDSFERYWNQPGIAEAAAFADALERHLHARWPGARVIRPIRVLGEGLFEVPVRIRTWAAAPQRITDEDDL